MLFLFLQQRGGFSLLNCSDFFSGKPLNISLTWCIGKCTNHKVWLGGYTQHEHPVYLTSVKKWNTRSTVLCLLRHLLLLASEFCINGIVQYLLASFAQHFSPKLLHVTVVRFHCVYSISWIPNNLPILFIDIQVLFPVFDVHMYAFLLNVFLGEEWLDCRAGMCPAFVDDAKKSSIVFILNAQGLVVFQMLHTGASTWYSQCFVFVFYILTLLVDSHIPLWF